MLQFMRIIIFEQISLLFGPQVPTTTWFDGGCSKAAASPLLSYPICFLILHVVVGITRWLEMHVEVWNTRHLGVNEELHYYASMHTVQEWLEIKIYCLWLFSTFHIHTWWGQSKYVWKFEISRANFEKSQNLYILKNFLWILCINMQNGSNSKELRHK